MLTRWASNPVDEQEQMPRVPRPWLFSLWGFVLLVLAVSLFLVFVIYTEGMWVICAPVLAVYTIAALLLCVSPRTRPLSAIAVVIGLASAFIAWRMMFPINEFSIMSAIAIQGISLMFGIPFLVIAAVVCAVSNRNGEMSKSEAPNNARPQGRSPSP